MAHPFFREEFSLPYDDFEPIIAQRRMRATASLPSSPAASPAATLPGSAAPSPRPPAASASTSSTTAGAAAKRAGGGSGGRKRAKNARSKLNLAGLVGGDSDSSALTMESGDEGGEPETPRESVVTGTDAGTEYAEDEDTEMREPSPGEHSSSFRVLGTVAERGMLAQEASPRPARGRPPGKAAGRGRGRGGATRGTSARGMKKKKR